LVVIAGLEPLTLEVNHGLYVQELWSSCG
jgi:hypothetical protein